MTANVLIVDDRPENLLALRAILEPLGCQIIEAFSGTQALKQLLSIEFALILMDVQMPGLDGFETASLIKEREKTRHVPIIFVTAISKEQNYVWQGYSAGAVDYIAKPFNPDILRSKVAVFIELWEKSEQIKRQAEALRHLEQLEKARELADLQRNLEERHLDTLAASEARLSRFKSTLDATLDSVLMFDPDSLRYTYANQGALAHLGYDFEEMLQLKAVDVKPKLTVKQFCRILAPLRAGKQATHTFETLHRRKNGEDVPVEVFLQFVSQAGEEDRFVSIVRDISERKRAQNLLVEAKELAERERASAEDARAGAEHQRERAERANNAKSEFIAGVSHELRTPLNAILGFSKLLLNPRVGPLNEDQTAYTRDVVQSAEHLLQLINDILDLSKIEAGKMELEIGWFELPALLEQSLTIVREEAHRKNIELSIAMVPEAAQLPKISADARKIKQVMYNLLSNAVKFTENGGSVAVLASFKCSEADDSPREVLVEVRDTGIGISDENQTRIFQAFEQVDNSYARQQQGTGLGLALTKRIIELHGGKIWLQSAPNEGSTFSFSLPISDSSAPEEPLPQARRKGA